MENSIFGLLVVINVLGFLLIVYDKHQAKSGKWRVPEIRFFTLGLLGGPIGILIGMKLVRHKTKHSSFTIGMPLLIALNILVYYLVFNGQ